MKKILIGAAALGTVALAGCNAQTTAITAAICTDATTLSTSGLALNTNQQLALNGVISSCNSTAGGTTFNNTTVALAIINDAILLQSSGLFKDVHITAQAPEQQQVLRKIRVRWEKLVAHYDFERRE